MKNIIIAPVGDNMDALFIGIREFHVSTIILISPRDRIREAQLAKMEIERSRYLYKLKRLLKGTYGKDCSTSYLRSHMM